MRTLANIVTRYASAIIIFWVVLFAVSAVFAIALPSKLQGDGFFVDDDHMRVTEELSETFGLPAAS